MKLIHEAIRVKGHQSKRGKGNEKWQSLQTTWEEEDEHGHDWDWD